MTARQLFSLFLIGYSLAMDAVLAVVFWHIVAPESLLWLTPERVDDLRMTALCWVIGWLIGYCLHYATRRP